MTPGRRFVYRLALALGESNPDAMLARMPGRVFREWATYAELEPFGEERADLRAGIVAMTVANCLARKKGKPAFRVKQFMPEFSPRRRKTGDELFQQIKVINALLGGEFIDKRNEAT